MKAVENVSLTINQWNEIQSNNERMEDALSFYANEDNYSYKDKVQLPINTDRGGKARLALGIHND